MRINLDIESLIRSIGEHIGEDIGLLGGLQTHKILICGLEINLRQVNIRRLTRLVKVFITSNLTSRLVHDEERRHNRQY